MLFAKFGSSGSDLHMPRVCKVVVLVRSSLHIKDSSGTEERKRKRKEEKNKVIVSLF